MAAPRIQRPSTRRFAWLLWVMLLLPVAQVAALWHGVSHVVPTAQQEAPAPGEPLSQAAHCDLCLLAATIHGGALPSAPILLPHPALKHQAPPVAFAAGWSGTPALPYRSRAPPASSL
ncbi:hypothetical protein [Variovorax sp. Sphag1AA]|uniref:hypothetical protein n=1 Tax=Variovorax sp. Sphag1AA TaxID=2587027 RepID=UPI001610D64E|nr:hypothetical protein [Variovorax sp. Sphag1AA]MBB3177840.1 hypothetical protein [Variovorax sp. Sphag1AA]